ncbi:MAG: hypothetical protein IPP72_03955 [Chitinophagaceae bacterium]|nr:hypothetical protein [Chitinophagaceae bacterium]
MDGNTVSRLLPYFEGRPYYTNALSKKPGVIYKATTLPAITLNFLVNTESCTKAMIDRKIKSLLFAGCIF